MHGRRSKLSKPKKQNKINSIRNPILKKNEKKEIIDRIMKDRIIRDIWKLFKTEKVKKRKKEIREKKKK